MQTAGTLAFGEMLRLGRQLISRVHTILIDILQFDVEMPEHECQDTSDDA